MKVHDIFTPGRFPVWTYVDDHLIDKEQQVHDVLADGSMLISISGPSKSGKTVFVEHVLGKDTLIQVTGAGIESVSDLWNRVFNIIGTPIPTTSTTTSTSSYGISAKGGASGSILVAKAKGELGATGTFGSQNSASETAAVDYLQLLIKELADTGLVIFIDDFHYIPREVQSELARQIKEAIRHGVKFICASVPYHSDDVIRGNPDLRGRIFSIDFDYWGAEVLEKIAKKGFGKANVDINEVMLERLVAEAAGSPQLMQYLCLNSCLEINRREVNEDVKLLHFNQDLFERICRRTAMSTDYGSVVDKMIEGPKTRGADRKIYLSKADWQGDVYLYLMNALALDPPCLTFRYQPLVDRINELCLKDSPSGSSITSGCFHAASIANSTAGDKIVEWDNENDVFDIRDPYLLFYIRWSGHLDSK